MVAITKQIDIIEPIHIDCIFKICPSVEVIGSDKLQKIHSLVILITTIVLGPWMYHCWFTILNCHSIILIYLIISMQLPKNNSTHDTTTALNYFNCVNLF